MNTKEAYKIKIEAELELAQAKLITWKAKAKNISADMNLEFNNQIGEIEKILEKLKTSLKELSEAGEDSWEKIKSAGDNALDSVKKYFQSLSDKFKI